jgi:uncharacterized protein YciI
MHIILLRFTDNRQNAAQHLPGHKAWLKRGFDEGAFLLAGSLGSDLGGAVLARGNSVANIQDRVNEDPFVREKIVSAEGGTLGGGARFGDGWGWAFFKGDETRMTITGDYKVDCLACH